MKSYFASPERVTDKELLKEIEFASSNPVMQGLLHSVSGMLAVLDESRQIIAVNDAFLNMLGVKDPSKAFGLRPGEALKCIYSDKEPAGCGTTKYCSTCGAAIAIVTSLAEDIPVERKCALSAANGESQKDLALLVRAHTVKLERQKFVLVFIQDITKQEQKAALERTFFHDINNLLSMLVGASELLVYQNPSEIAKTINNASLRLIKEVDIQSLLSQSESGSYKPSWNYYTTMQILEELQTFFFNHPAAKNKKVDFSESCPVYSVKADIFLLLRVLCNMVLNALEAEPENGTAKVWVELSDTHVSFNVWNEKEIPEEVSRRIFQRNFTTKEQPGRGLGTYSMKLLGETILGGHVSFTTSKQKGTVFKFSLLK